MAKKDVNKIIIDIQLKIDKATKGLKQLADKLKNVNGVNASVSNSSGKVNNVFSKLTKTVGALSPKMAALLSKLGGAGGIGAAFAALGLAVKSVLDSFMPFERQLSTLAGVLGTTKDNIGFMREQAIQLGASSEYSATQVVKLQVALSKLGFSMGEIGEMTSSILQGALGMASGLSSTANVVGAVIRSFNMDASDTAHVIDVLTLATQKSALSFDKLQVALPIVAGAAAAVNVSLEEVVATLGKVSDSGIVASTASTSLRNIYIELSKSGLTFAEAMLKIRASMDPLATATEIFGKRASVTSLIIAQNTDELGNLEKQLIDSKGSAKALAAEMTDNLEGAVKRLTTAWDTLKAAVWSSNGPFRQNIEMFAALLGLVTALSASEEYLGSVAGGKMVKNLKEKYKFTNDFNKALKEEIKNQQDIMDSYGNDTKEYKKAAATKATLEKQGKAASDAIRTSNLKDFMKGMVSEKETEEEKYAWLLGRQKYYLNSKDAATKADGKLVQRYIAEELQNLKARMDSKLDLDDKAMKRKMEIEDKISKYQDEASSNRIKNEAERQDAEFHNRIAAEDRANEAYIINKKLTQEEAEALMESYEAAREAKIDAHYGRLTEKHQEYINKVIGQEDKLVKAVVGNEEEEEARADAKDEREMIRIIDKHDRVIGQAQEWEDEANEISAEKDEEKFDAERAKEETWRKSKLKASKKLYDDGVLGEKEYNDRVTAINKKSKEANIAIDKAEKMAKVNNAQAALGSIGAMFAANAENSKASAKAGVLINSAAAAIGIWKGYASLGPWGIAGAAAQTIGLGISTGNALSKISNTPLPGAGKEKKKFAFADGGIVPGNSFTGDNVIAHVNSSEMVLNMQQQTKLFSKLNGQEEGYRITEERVVELSAQTIAAIPVNLVEHSVTDKQREVKVRDYEFNNIQ